VKKLNDNLLLSVKNLRKWFPMGGGLFTFPKHFVKAVDDISFDVYKGKTFGLVGESGCGKSTLGRVILHLLKPTSGKIIFENKDITNVKGKKMQELRSNMQMIFQDPYASLNPRMTVGYIIKEPLIVHNIGSKKERQEKLEHLLEIVGLDPLDAYKYPHEFSGGQRQRIGIARALSLNPKLIICDEPVSALDVSIQSQILNILKRLQKEFNLTYIFISHDLSVVKYISDTVGVMYLGKLVELADKNSLFEMPLHPYTAALLSAIPVPDPTRKIKRTILKGDVPSPIDPPSGCRFRTRCPKAKKICSEEEPLFKKVFEKHYVACHLI